MFQEVIYQGTVRACPIRNSYDYIWTVTAIFSDVKENMKFKRPEGNRLVINKPVEV